MKNELFVLHLNGERLDPKIWKKYSKNYGNNQLYGWRPPKKVYYTIGHARNGIRYLPKEIQPDIQIVRYVPEGKQWD